MKRESTRNHLYSHKYLSVASSALLLFSLGSLAGCAVNVVPNDGNTDQGFNENYDQYRDPYKEGFFDFKVPTGGPPVIVP